MNVIIVITASAASAICIEVVPPSYYPPTSSEIPIPNYVLHDVITNDPFIASNKKIRK